MEDTRRSFLRKSGYAGLAMATFARLGAITRPLARLAFRNYGLYVSAVGPLAGRATWPAICAIALRNAQANAALGIAGSAAALAAAMKLFAQATGRAWYNPVLRPSLRNLTTGTVR